MTTFKLILSGNVQGVGMRFFVHRSARQFGINGSVKNLMNGTVEAVIQGEEKILGQFIEYIKENAPGYIDQLKKDAIDTKTEYKKFTIKLF